MTTWTLTLTPVVNRSLQTTADQKVPKDWSAEGALDTSLDSNYKSTQRNGFIGTFHSSTLRPQITWRNVGDQASAAMSDAVVAITAYPGVTIV